MCLATAISFNSGCCTSIVLLFYFFFERKNSFCQCSLPIHFNRMNLIYAIDNDNTFLCDRIANICVQQFSTNFGSTLQSEISQMNDSYETEIASSKHFHRQKKKKKRKKE